jgi:hypothetical protein
MGERGNHDRAIPIVTIYHERDDVKIDEYCVYGVAPVFA